MNGENPHPLPGPGNFMGGGELQPDRHEFQREPASQRSMRFVASIMSATLPA
jgi:hypothetical protein